MDLVISAIYRQSTYDKELMAIAQWWSDQLILLETVQRYCRLSKPKAVVNRQKKPKL